MLEDSLKTMILNDERKGEEKANKTMIPSTVLELSDLP